jgi:RNA polymerase sigma-70 factor (ECF subfamily)
MLDGLRKNVPQQWDRFVKLCGPLVYEWCRRASIQEADAADITQEVFKIVAEKIVAFRRDQPGDSFHGWLYGITRHRCQDFFRQSVNRAVAVGGSSFQQQLNHTSEETDAENEPECLGSDRQRLYLRALDLIKTEFEPQTWQAFWRLTVDEQPAKLISEELGMTRGAVYNAKYKVLRRLRLEFAEIIALPPEI